MNYIKHRGQAENQLEMFDIPRFEAFANSWARLLGTPANSAENFFHSNSLPETFINQKYRR
jgi:hypothetical protein